MGFRSDRMTQEIDAQFRRGIGDQWWESCRGARVGLYFDTPTGTTEVLPTVTRVYGLRSFDVELPRGMVVGDLRKHTDRLAAGMDVPALRITENRARPRTVSITLLLVDPLAGTVPYPVQVPNGHLGFGVDEGGDVVSCPLDEWTHTAVQGSTGSGKSGAGYNLLGQLRGFGPLVDVVGIDPTGSLLGPWGPHPRGWRVTGTKDAAERYPAVLRVLCDDMDRRIGEIPPRCDTLPVGPDHPLRVVVLEEQAGISRLTGFKSSGVPSETQKLTARLASEGRKAGYRLVVISQRLGSDVLGTDVRDQLLTRFTFDTRDLATLRMLSPGATAEDLAPLAGSPPGVALFEQPGGRLRRIRGPWVGSYGAYYDLITA